MVQTQEERQMDTDAVKETIKGFDWYQTIEFEPGIVARGYDHCGDPVWPAIRNLLPVDLRGLRILDLGCNAGIFCVRAALEGASCVGVDSNCWKGRAKYLQQAEFVKSYFEDKAGHPLDIKFIQAHLDDYVSQKLEPFDYCLAIASIYYSEDSEYVVERLAAIAKHVILRIRDREKRALFEGLFKSHGFVLKVAQDEDLTNKFGRPMDDFFLYLYGR